MPDEKAKQPAQVPGDAESPPRDEHDATPGKANRHTDPTEPVRTQKDIPPHKPA